VVRNNILGEAGKSLEKKTRQTFTDWKPIREEVIKLVFKGQREEAAIITMGKGADHVIKLESVTLELSSYAINKAAGFMKHADLVRSRVERNTIILILIGIFLSIIVAFITVRNVLAVEDVLLESEKKYQDLYDNAPDMFASVDAKTATIVNCNQTLANQLGYTKEDIVGRPIFDMYTQDSAEYSKEKLFPVFLRTGTIEGEELQLQRKDGSTLDVSLNVSAIRNEKGDIIHSRSIWRDINERKQAEEEHINRVKLQAVLETAGAACHELNQPMQAISGYSELLSMGISEKNPLYEKVGKIKEQIDRMGKITAKLMGITRYETKVYSGDKKIIDLDNVIERRKYKRVIPCSGAFVLPKSDSPKQHQIIDISIKGLAFWCNEIQDQSDEFNELSIKMTDGNFSL
jgi:PAS domain S-box-containing protein